MYTYYVLRRASNDNAIELEGEIDETSFPGIDLSNAPALLAAIIQKAQAEGQNGPWEECDLTDSFFNQEDTYIYFHNRWIRRSDAPWRKDRNN
jgi:hypothetical protein